MVYRSCLVPQCTNTTINTPHKLFVSIPTNPQRRKKWLQLAQRNSKNIVSHLTGFMCEDHFDKIMKCCVLPCKNYSDRRSDAMDGITFHLFPSEENLKQQWISKINRQDWTPTKYTKICSCHFNDEDFIVTKKGLRKLKKGTLPCIKLDNISLKRKLPDPTISPKPSTSDLNEFLILHDTPRKKKLKQEIAQLRWKLKKDRLKIRRLQMRVKRLKKKVEKDIINYMKYKMGFSQKLLLAEEVVPTKFHCQEDSKRQPSDAGSAQEVEEGTGCLQSQVKVVMKPRLKAIKKMKYLLNKDLVNYYQWKFMSAIPRLKPTAMLRYSIENKPSQVGDFQLPNGIESYTKYYLMNSIPQVQIKTGCLPTRLAFQSDRQIETETITTQPLQELSADCEKEIEQVNSSVSMAEVQPGPSSENPSLTSVTPTPSASETTVGITRKLINLGGDEIKRKVLKKTAVPSIFSFTKVKSEKQQRLNRHLERSRRRLCLETAPGPSGFENEKEKKRWEWRNAKRIKRNNGVTKAKKNTEADIKSEPEEDQYETPEQNNEINLEDIKIEVEEHPVASNIEENVPVFMPCTRQILPKINMFSIVEYIVQNAAYKDIDYKMLKTEIDINAEDTIGFVQLHKMDDQLTLQATVAFDRDTAHTCIVKYDQFTHTIDYTNCQCQQTACQHILAFLMWLHRRSEEQLDNDMSFCLEPLVQQTTFLKAKDIVYDSDTDSLSADLDMPENMEQIQQDIVHEFVRTCKELKMYNSPLYRYLNGNEQLELSLPRMHGSWRDAGEGEGEGADRFLQYCTERMAEREDTLHELGTCRDYIVRRELQYARLDGRQLFEARSVESGTGQLSRVKMQELIDDLLNPDLHLEDEFIENMKTTLEKQLNVKINKCGIILCKEYPLFCAVPYGFTDTHLVEFGYFENEEDCSNYMEAKVLKPHLQFRMQFNMLLAKKEKSYFFLGYKEGNIAKRIFIHELKFNRNYCNSFIEKGIRFWEDNVFDIFSSDHST